MLDVNLFLGNGSIFFIRGDGSIDLLGDGSKSLEEMNAPHLPLDLHPCLSIHWTKLSGQSILVKLTKTCSCKPVSSICRKKCESCVCGNAGLACLDQCKCQRSIDPPFYSRMLVMTKISVHIAL